MMNFEPERIWVSRGDQLIEGSYLRMDVEYAGEIIPVVVFRYKGICKAFRNQCVHMPRQLDCELGTIFDSTGNYLRCSMHGIVYDPLSGISVGTMCNGEQLTPIGIAEDDRGVWIQDMRVKPANAQDTSARCTVCQDSSRVPPPGPALNQPPETPQSITLEMRWPATLSSDNKESAR